VIIALVAGTLLSLRASAKTGMPPEDVLERARRRARELESRETDNNNGG
jgi:hypothetical protein